MISELGPNVFKALPRMSSLDLESNRIARIDSKAFMGLEGKRAGNPLVVCLQNVRAKKKRFEINELGIQL